MRSLTLLLSGITATAGYNCLYIGHSFHNPIGRDMTELAADAPGVSHTAQEVFSPGSSGTPSALWSNNRKKNDIRAILNTGSIDLLAMPMDGAAAADGTMLTEGYERWIDYALSKNPNTVIVISSPWLSYPSDFDTPTYTSMIRDGIANTWSDLMTRLRALYPSVTILDNPYALGVAEARLLFDAGELGADVDSLFGECAEDDTGNSACGNAMFGDYRGHVGPFIRKLSALFWLNRIYNVDLSTFSSDQLINSFGGNGVPFETDLPAVAKAVLDAYDAGDMCGTTPCYTGGNDGTSSNSGSDGLSDETLIAVSVGGAVGAVALVGLASYAVLQCRRKPVV